MGTLASMTLQAEQLAIPPELMGDRIRRAMRHAGISREQLAVELEVSTNSVSNWTNDNHRPRLRDAKGIARVCGVPLDWLLYGDAPKSELRQYVTRADNGLEHTPPSTAEIHTFRKALRGQALSNITGLSQSRVV